MMQMRWPAVTAAVAIVMAAICLPPAAHATQPEADGAGAHCVQQIYPVGEDRSSSPVCFDSAEEADSYLANVGAMSTAGRGTASNTVVGTVYKDTNASGASLTFWGSSGCAGVTYGFSSLPSGWDNSISSVRASNGCWVTLYTATNYGGARLNCTPYCASIGSWNDNVKSLVFRPSGTFG